MLTREQRIKNYLKANPGCNLRRYEMLRVYSDMAHAQGGWTPTEREFHRTFNEQAPGLGFKTMSLSCFRDHLKTLKNEGFVRKINNLISVPRARWIPPKGFPARGVKVKRPAKAVRTRSQKSGAQAAATGV